MGHFLCAWVRDLYWSSPQTTFAVNPLTVVLAKSLRGRVPFPDKRFLPLLAWGYLQYRLASSYRMSLGGGAGGMAGFPDRLVTSGPYALTRNPMYLGHLIFSLGLVLAFRSPVAAGLLFLRAVYFSLRVLTDEERLERHFGQEYLRYRERVSRWVPGLL